MQYLKLFFHFFLYLLFLFPLLISFYNDLLLAHPLKITLTPANYPAIEIDLSNSYGIPHIYSDNLQGSLYGLGYMHAKDRLWQMQVKRLAAYGRLAEYFGEEILFVDKFFRTLGLLEVCKKNLQMIERTDPETMQNLIAYSSGINAYVNQRLSFMKPLEFLLISVEWEE